MKKVIAIFLFLCLCCGICACSGDPSKGGDPSAKNPADDTGQPTENTADTTEQLTEETTEETGLLSEKLDSFIVENQSAIDDLNRQFEDVVVFSMQKEGTELILLATYQVDTDEDFLSIALANGDSYVQLYEKLKQRAGSDEVKLTLRILSEDGGTIREEVIDGNYTPTPEADRDTLADFVNSEFFQSTLASDDPEDGSFSAITENGDTIVLIYKLTETVEPGLYDMLKTEFEEEFGDGSTEESFLPVYELVETVYHEVNFKLRIIDAADVTIYEKVMDFNAAE